MAVEQPIELEGTWEEILTHANELAGRRVRVVVLPGEPAVSVQYPHSTAGALLKHVGKWSGNDFEKCLENMYAARGKAEF
jgi:hypothetical protein